MRNDPLKLRTAWFQPKARRVIVTGICGFWALTEIAMGLPFLALMAVAMTGYLIWVFFVTWEDIDGGEAP